MKQLFTTTKAAQRLIVWRTVVLFAFFSVMGVQTAKAQYTAIPDPIFEQVLINNGWDTGPIDGQVPTANINFRPNLDVTNAGISDLTGIQDFTALQELRCPFNPLTSLNINGLTNLLRVDCGYTQITSLNVSGLTNLFSLGCGFSSLTNLNASGCSSLTNLQCNNSQLTNINVSGCTSLVLFYCYNNQLTSLNVSGLTALDNLNCSFNQLTTINLSGLTALRTFFASYNQLTSLDLRGLNTRDVRVNNNPNLTCIALDNLSSTMANGIYATPPASLSTNCFFNSTINYCKGATAVPLTVTGAAAGSTLKWYTVATGGTGSLTAPTPSTAYVGTRNYYVSQTVNGVESARITITVIVNALPTLPGAISGIAAQGPLVGTTTLATYSIAPVTGATAYEWTAPAGVNIIGANNGTSVTVNFLNVSSGAGIIGNLSVKAINSNGCKGTARNLALTKALPAAPSSLKMTLGTATTAITSFAKYMGTTTELKLTAATVAAATSYDWELPAGVNRTDGVGTNSTLPSITVNFSGVNTSNTFSYTTASGVLTYVLRIGVKAKNGVGVSVSNNGTLVNPTTTSSARQLTLTAVRPAAVSAVAGQTKGLCGGSTYTYTITDTALASSYTVTAPAGAVVNFTSTLTFTVTYPPGFVINASTTPPNKSLVITSVNGIGTSATSRTLTLSTTMPAIGTVYAGLTSYGSSSFNVFPIPGLKVYFWIDPVPGAVSYTWIPPSGGSTIYSGQGTNSVVFELVFNSGFSAVMTPRVFATNACGVSSLVKTFTINVLQERMASKQNNLVNKITLYPNPVSSLLTIETTNGIAIDTVIVTDLLGKVIYEGKPENNELNVEGFASGTYILQSFIGEERFTSKFIKE